MGKVCFVSSIVCEFKGEFIRTLENIEKEIVSSNAFDGVVYVFPKQAQNVGYMKDFEKTHKVYFLSQPNPSSIKKVVDFYKFFLGMKQQPQFLELEKIVKDEQVSIIHSHFEEFDFVCHQVAKKTNVKCFINYHDALIDSYRQIKNPFARAMKLHLIKKKYKKLIKIDSLVAVSPYCQEQLNKFLKTNKVLYIENALDETYIKQQPFSPKITSFASIVTRVPKGIYTILDAGRILKDQSVDFKLNLICTDKTKKIVEDEYADLLDYVNIMLPVDDINKLFDISDCYISASYFETFSYGIAEALMAGLPCINSGIKSTRWSLKSNYVQTYKLKDPSDLAKKMLEAIKTGAEKEKRDFAISYMLNNYSMKDMVSKVVEMYKGERL